MPLRWPRSGWLAALFFAAVAFVYFWPALTGRAVLSPVTVVYDWVPWRDLRPADLAEYRNPLLEDHAREFYPWLEYARDRLRAGELPQWNPYVLAGTPFLANPGVALFSPFNVFIWILPFQFALGLVAVLKLWVAAFGTYLLGRELRLNFWPSLLAGSAFGFAPFNLVWLSHTHVNVVVFLPLAVWAAERLVTRGRGVDALVLAAVLTAALLGGHPGSQIHIFLAVALYGVLRLAFWPLPSWRERGGRLGLALAAFVVSTGIAAVALLPGAYLVPDSAALLHHEGGGAARPLTTLRTLFFPDWWGRPSGVRVADDPSNFNERTFYAGVVPLLLAVVACLDRRAWRRRLPFMVLALLGVVVPLGLPPFDWFFGHVPPFNRVLNSRLIFFLDFAVAVLGAFGLQRLLARGSARRRAYIVAGAALAVGIGFAAAVTPSGTTVGRVVEHFLTGAEHGGSTFLALTSIAWWLILVVGFLVALVLARQGTWWLAPALVALVVLDLGHFGRGYQPLAPTGAVPPPTPSAVKWLRGRIGGDRFVGLGKSLPPDTGMLYRLRDIRGYDSPLPKLDYLRFFQTRAGVGSSRLAIRRLDARRRRVLDALSVRYVIAPPNAVRPRLPAFVDAYRGDDAAIFENEQSLARAYVPSRVVARARENEAFAAVFDPAFDPSVGVVVEAAGGIPAARGSVELIHDAPSRVELDARLEEEGLVVLADAWAEGWSVTVDGRPAGVLRVNTVTRGVVVPAGTHRIVWRYWTPGLTPGLAITGAALAAAAAWGAWLLLRRRRPAPG
jgi:membrane protein YfhO